MTSRYFVAFCLTEPGQATFSRFGFTVPRSLGKAVVRNRIKRRMREAVRTHLENLSNNGVLIFNPRRSVLDAPFKDLCREVGRVLARCAQS